MKHPFEIKNIDSEIYDRELKNITPSNLERICI